MPSGTWPEEPHLRSEPALLSPASPKPMHFPTPTNIPVLDNMMDVDFNQTEAHMADPAMHNTEIRPGAWQDPDAPKGEGAEQTSPEADATANATTAQQGVAQSHDETSADAGQQQGASDASQPIPTATPAKPQGPFDVTAAQPEAFDEFNVPTTEPVAHPAVLPFQSAEGGPVHPSTTPAGSNVDVQALLNHLQTTTTSTPSANAAPTGEGLTVATVQSPSQSRARAPGIDSSPVSAAGLGAPPAGLPPRPPPQDQPLINSNYAHTAHIRDYHPHAANPAVSNNGRGQSAGNAADPNSGNFVPAVLSPGAAHNHSTKQSISEQASAAAAYQQSAAATANRVNTTPLESRREYKLAAGLNLTEEDKPWTADTQRKYDKFLAEEREYVSEGRWDQFPYGSRLFVGNLSSEKVTKRDIYYVFHKYGDLAQISIKQAYGFVQFLNAQDCANALAREEGRQIRDKKIHLEVSKPQRNRPQPQDQAQPQYNARRRSRSPDFHRGNDRYGGGRGGGRERDGYRPYTRSPSPPRYREPHYRDRSPAGYGRRPVRSHSPDEDLPLPRRSPKDVPEVQILVIDNLNRDFIAWVEKAFQARGLTVDVLLLSPRLDVDAVMRRQLVEGVLAVCRLDRNSQNTGRLNLRLFDRTRGPSNLRFDDYDNQDPQICVELVLRQKNTPTPQYNQYGSGSQYPSAPPQQQAQYGYPPQATPQQQPPQHYSMPPVPTGFPPGYNPQQAQPPPSAPPAQPNLQQLITSLDPKGLQNLLSAMGQQPQTPQFGAPQQLQHQQQHQTYTPQQGGFAGQQQAAMQALQRDPSALAGLLQQQQGQTPAHARAQAPQQQGGAAGQVDMQEILARLGTYK